MFKRHRTQVVFWSCVLGSLLSLGVLYRIGLVMLPVLLASIGFNVWSLIQSEQEGFVKTRQARRAYEPARHFNVVQVLLVLVLILLQIAAGVHRILELK